MTTTSTDQKATTRSRGDFGCCLFSLQGVPQLLPADSIELTLALR